MSGVYSHAELEALGIPLALGDDSELVCDAISCTRRADLLIPGGAALCRTCFEGFVVRDEDGSGFYCVAAEEIIDSIDFRRARDAEWRERLGRAPGEPVRHESWDRRLDEIASDAAVALIESVVGCLP
jgi:hypothetical protein